MKIFTENGIRSKLPGSLDYAQGMESGLDDIQANLPLNHLYRHALDEFSFGYRSAYYERLRPAGKTLALPLGGLSKIAA